MLGHVVLVFLLAVVGGVFYRFRGGWPKLPRPLEQCLFCLPIIYVSLGSEWYLTALAYALSVVVVLKGHGHTMDLGHSDKGDFEWYEKVTGWRFFHGKMSEYWYDVIGHSIGGLFITLPLLLTNPALSAIGLLKGPAYMIGWTDKIPSVKIGNFTLMHETEWGEFLTGFFVWGVLLYLQIEVLHSDSYGNG